MTGAGGQSIALKRDALKNAALAGYCLLVGHAFLFEHRHLGRLVPMPDLLHAPPPPPTCCNQGDRALADVRSVNLTLGHGGASVKVTSGRVGVGGASVKLESGQVEGGRASGYYGS